MSKTVLREKYMTSWQSGSRILDKYIIYTKDLKKEHDICCVPFYMASSL